MRSDIYQILLILAGVIVTTLFGVFLYREIFPEYKIYQNDYLALEEFRSTYTHQPIPPFQMAVKQIVIENENHSSPVIDRCVSCHVALQIPYFSPTKITHDLNGNIVRDLEGHPVLIPNEEYIWQKLDEKIAGLRDEKVLEQLKNQGLKTEVNQRLDQAAKYEALKTAHVEDQVYDVTKVLAMHPLMGNETYPFQYHPIEEYGCTSCHNGNGRGLVTDKSHGPVFDGQYEIEDLGPTPRFTQSDPENDPRFASIFNHHPGSKLVFQTEPIFVGSLIQAKCVQCHQTAHVRLNEVKTKVSDLALLRQQRITTLTAAYGNEKQATLDLLKLHQMVEELGYAETFKQLQTMENDDSLPALELEHLASEMKYLKQAVKGQSEELKKNAILAKLNQDLVNLLGSNALVQELESVYRKWGTGGVDSFLKEHQHDPQATGVLFAKAEALDFNQDLMRHAQEAQQSFSKATDDKKLMSALISDVDELTRDYQRGKFLYLSQACYACHRITGFSRGGIGPELTLAGNLSPWYMKRKLMWPQGDLRTSTMPNMHLDSEELEDLMTFLLAQKGENRSVAKTDYQSAILAWEAGRKMEWEKPLSPSKVYDLRDAMKIFATQGCAACHRLQGFESNVGFAIEKQSHALKDLYEQQQWFKKLFPEVVHFSHYDEEFPGSEIVATIDHYAAEIDERIVDHVRQNSLLEEIDKEQPESLDSLYSPFRYAQRAKNHHYQNLIEKEQNPERITQIKQEWQLWKDRVHRVLMMYIQIYGLGRLVGPHLNWSGIYRSDEWLMEHFHNPASHVPRSLMPVFPFDDTKFYALTHMLDVLAVHNRNNLRAIWDEQGFDPAKAYDTLCAQCHGIDRVGNGVIAEWIYPIPKNLRNPEFLRNLTKDRAIYSIKHGVKGTPMPPWGEVASDKPSDIQKISHDISVLKEGEIRYLVDWIFTSLSGGEVIRQSTDVPKWQYTPEEVLKELEKEGGHLIPLTPEQQSEKKLSFLSAIHRKHYAAILPIFHSEHKSKSAQQYDKVEDVFDVVSSPTDTGKLSYYIKQKFYTPDNIEQGQKFFLMNCAVCHGNEADGSGIRSQVMQEAKPRMLTNLDWINSRDDLRLLRSIKYGVPGTAMTPWGDLTSSLQRLQLVIFIHSLTREQETRSQLFEALYQAFESAQMVVEKARIEESKQMDQLQQEAQQLRRELNQLEQGEIGEKGDSQGALQIYQQSLEVDKRIKKLQEQDVRLLDLKSKIKTERDLYYNLGVNLMSKDLPLPLLQRYFDLIHLHDHRYTLQDHQLVIHHDKKLNDQVRAIRQEIIDELDKKIAALEAQRKILEGKIFSAKRREELSVNQANIVSEKKMKTNLMTHIEEALRLADEQAKMVEQEEHNRVRDLRNKNEESRNRIQKKKKQSDRSKRFVSKKKNVA